MRKLVDFEVRVDFEQACNKFKAAGGTLPEKEKMRYLIRVLPASYSFIGSFIDLVPEAQQTVDYVKSKIQEKMITVPDNEKRKNVSTFNVKTKGQYYNCGREGHFKKDCWRPLQTSQSRGAFQTRGASQSRGRGQRGSQRGYQRDSSRGRGRDRGAAQQRQETPVNAVKTQQLRPG